MAQQTTSGQRLAIWIGSIAVVLLVVVGLGLKVQWDARYRTLEQAKADWPERFQEIRSERYETFEQIAEKVVNTTTTPEEIVEILGGNIIHETEHEAWHSFIDDDFLLGISINYGYEMDRNTFKPRNTGIIEGARTMSSVEFGYIDFGALREPLAPKVVRQPAEALFESAHKVLAPRISGTAIPWTILLWIVILIFAWFFVAYRPFLFAGSIWLITLSGLVLMLTPRYDLLSETMDNDPLFWIVLMLLMTVGVIIWDKIESRPDPAGCPMCGYMLKGNTTGRCPECGEKIESTQRKYLEQLT